MCFYCVSIGDGVGCIIIWWVDFCVGFRIGWGSFMNYVEIGRRGENYGSGDLWNGVCLLCF